MQSISKERRNNMRIGIFTDTYPPYINGVSTSIVMLEHTLQKMGHQVFIVTVNPDKYKFEEKDNVIRIPGIPIGIYDYRLTGIYPVRAINKIKSWDLDVIHSQTEFGIGTFARIIAKQLDIPLVHTYHTMYEDYVHYITHGYFDKSSKKVVEYLTKFYCDKTATELIVPTKKTYDLFKEKYHVDRNIHIIPTGIEVERFYKEKIKTKDVQDLKNRYHIKENDFVILFVGRLGKEKNVDLLLDAHISLSRKKKNCKLVIIGDGPDAEGFKKKVKYFHMEDSVIFVGKVPWDKIPLYYQLGTVFATASLTETQGLTVVEAMAASIPVLAIDDEAFNSVVIDGLNGKLFKNKKEYKKIVLELMNQKDLVCKMGNQARISAEAHSSKYFAEKVLSVYKSALGDRGEKGRTFLEKVKHAMKRGFHGKW